MEFKDNPEILVIGGGAIGGFYGGKLAQGGAKVSMVCRSNYEAVKAQGVRISSPWGDFSFLPEKVIRKAQDFEGFPDYILVTLKSSPCLNHSRMIRNVVGDKTAIILLQNGIDIECPYVEDFPNNEIISGLAFVCVSSTKAGFVEHQDFGRLTFGKYPIGPRTPKIKALADIFNRVGVPCSISEDIILERWKKLLWNASFNPVSVLGGGQTTQAIMDCPDAANLVEEVMIEVSKVAQTTGNEITPGVIHRHLEDTRAMRPYKTSMLLDYEAGKTLEIDAILGNVIKIAKNSRVEIPCIKTMFTLLKLRF